MNELFSIVMLKESRGYMIKSMKIHHKHLRVQPPKRTFQPLHVAASAGTVTAAAGASASGEGDGSAPRNGWGSIARSAWTVMADHREERHQKKDDFWEF